MSVSQVEVNLAKELAEVKAEIEQLDELCNARLGALKMQLKENERLREALEFYADPETYFAIAFLPDPPCGPFIHDTDDVEPGKPGAVARRALALKACAGKE
jgi:hypothetical protein